MPFAFFYDRQAMSDPSWRCSDRWGSCFDSLLNPLGLIHSASLRDAPRDPKGLLTNLSGICFASPSHKIAGILYAPLPCSPRSFFKKIATRFVIQPSHISCLPFTCLRFAFASREIGSPFGNSSDWCHSPQCQGQFNFSQSANSSNNIRLYFESVQYFYTYPLWLLASSAHSQIAKHFSFLSLRSSCFPYIPSPIFSAALSHFHLVPISALFFRIDQAHGLDCFARDQRSIKARSFKRCRRHRCGGSRSVGNFSTRALPRSPIIFLPLSVFSIRWVGGTLADSISSTICQSNAPPEKRFIFWSHRVGIYRFTRVGTRWIYMMSRHRSKAK